MDLAAVDHWNSVDKLLGPMIYDNKHVNSVRRGVERSIYTFIIKESIVATSHYFNLLCYSNRRSQFPLLSIIYDWWFLERTAIMLDLANEMGRKTAW